ncbi:MAG: tetratricopeptide repeat protein [Steroidobacteraceae bacterium]
MNSLTPRFCGLAVALAMLAPVAQAIPDANGAVTSTPAPDISADGAMAARLNYNMGFERFEKTQALEATSPTSPEIRKGYAEARERFRAAAAADSNMKEAWNLVGYTSRRLGDYEASLQAYDAALKLQRDYPEAIEYRAELFLLTGRLDDARAAYAELSKSSPSYAGTLLQSMRDVLASGKLPASVSADQRAAFAAWVKAQPL